MEILNNKAITPHRLHAMVRLVPKLRNPKREDLLDLVQPPALIESAEGRIDQSTASSVLSAAEQNDLLQLTEDRESYRLHETIQDLSSKIDRLDEFRLIMQKRMSDVQSEHNPLMRQFTAWYTVQNERVFRNDKSKYALADRFTDEMSDRDIVEKGRLFNDTKYDGWLQWAEFLGWGWKMNLGFDRLVPNCAIRVKAILPELLPQQNEEVMMTDFMQRISMQCVELDGGIEFKRCWAASRPNEPRSNQLSLMLSSGLRTLEKKKLIKLITYDDSPEMWRLFPVETMQENVSHIKRIKRGAR